LPKDACRNAVKGAEDFKQWFVNRANANKPQTKVQRIFNQDTAPGQKLWDLYHCEQGHNLEAPDGTFSQILKDGANPHQYTVINGCFAVDKSGTVVGCPEKQLCNKQV